MTTARPCCARCGSTAGLARWFGRLLLCHRHSDQARVRQERGLRPWRTRGQQR